MIAWTVAHICARGSTNIHDPEDGQLWVVGVGEDGVMAFTDDGIDNLKELIAIHKEDPSIIEKRRQVLAAMMKPKTEESDEI